jgi:hypothetical protein
MRVLRRIGQICTVLNTHHFGGFSELHKYVKNRKKCLQLKNHNVMICKQSFSIQRGGGVWRRDGVIFNLGRNPDLSRAPSPKLVLLCVP